MNSDANTTGRALARGSAWVAIGQVFTALAGLIGSIFAARLLDPKDFGLMGVAILTLSTLAAFSQTGFDRALIFEKDADEFMHAAFTVQVVRGALLGAVVALLGHPLALFYDEPRLFPIFLVMAASMFATGLRNVTTVYFHRALDFRTLVMVSSIKALVKLGVIVSLAYLLRSVWALVLGNLAAALVDLVQSYMIRVYRPRFVWDKRRMMKLVDFGKWISVMSVLGLLVTRGDDMFISKYLGMAALGIYSFAYEIANIPATHVTGVVGRVSFPAYARLNDGSTRAHMRRVFFNVMKATLLITAPLSMFVFLAIEPIVQFVLGDKWQAIVPLVRILIVAGFLRSVAGLATGVFHGAGRPHLDFWMNLPRLILLTVLIWPACAFFGLEGASWLVLLAVLSCFPTWYRGLSDILHFSPADLVRESGLVLAVTLPLLPCYLATERLLAPVSVAGFALQMLLCLSTWALCLWALQSTTRFRLFDEVRALGRALRKSPA